MGKQSRLRKQRKNDFPTLEYDGRLTPEMIRASESYFADMSGPLEPITDGLIAELIINGWEEKPLREAQAMGLRYSRKRNSFWQ